MELHKVNPKGTLFGSRSERRFNGMVPHWPKTHGCSVNGHVRRVNLKNSRSALVTGGAGYFGFRLSCTLAQSGVSVILVDIHKPRWCLPEGAVFLQSDIRDYDALYRACEGVDCVYHAASYGMSGTEQLHKEQIESVNIGGTRKVIDVCLHRNIPCLIYTSTVNVVFGGQQIHQGDEDTVPYVPLDKHVDHYSKTKAIADQMVLAADGTSLKGGKKFRTCVLRPPGIYGPQEQRHLARVAVNIERRLFSFTFGNPDTKMNWVHVDNLVQAHILAGEALTAAKGHVASGQVYYINDGEAVNVFDWLSPLFVKLGYKPWFHVPVHFIYIAAIIMEHLHMALRPIIEISPLLTRNEVRSIAVTHTFKIDKARKQLGYCPKKYNFADSVEFYMKTRPKQDNALSLFLKVLFIMSIFFLLICLSPKPQAQGPSLMQFSKHH
ncbi:putative short-chain dehydrogenase/reductase family 42E member 2 [Hemiscyllium ocellatum]|uniref:putative short-chain dehydrogenase/reductase family 42E member 2 n=1 Tax=Hemiscyllium ocellatum TaxID=170820 RepID=UPI002966D096|nr:putative short-chain dehydrogenase/reductase family 42E member 2 [Hemiscyllium ocellatum]